jgi:hypothetical protein
LPSNGREEKTSSCTKEKRRSSGDITSYCSVEPVGGALFQFQNPHRARFITVATVCRSVYPEPREKLTALCLTEFPGPRILWRLCESAPRRPSRVVVDGRRGVGSAAKSSDTHPAEIGWVSFFPWASPICKGLGGNRLRFRHSGIIRISN